MKILNLAVAIYWSAWLIMLMAGEQPHDITIGVSFFVTAAYFWLKVVDYE